MKTLKVILQEVVSGMKAWVNSNFAQDSNTVHKNGNETINGVKTFSDGIVVANVAVDSIAWENITDKPSSFTPSSHTHDTSEITDFPTLATVATSGSYNDLSDKPTIPTVNNATLTIQKNGTDVNTFTANASSNVTANITVPTKTSDLTNDSGFLTSHQSLSNYVTLNGEQTISGNKTFTGTLTGTLTGNCSGSSSSCTGNAATATTATKVVGTVANDNTGALVQGTMGTNDCFRIAIGGASNAGWAEIATGDDYNEPIYVRQYQGSFATLKRTATLLDASGNTSFPGTVTATGFSGPLTGNVTGNCSGSAGSCTGNAATSTQFSANTTVALTGDATGTSAGSKKGWSVPVTLANSGVTAGSYGPTADVTGNNNATISVPQITVDAKGRVTAVVNRTLTCKNNTYNVYNKTLTIQKNGTNVATFTSNSNTDVTANITVPTKTSELTNNSGFLTSHQSLNSCVKTSGDQDIDGNKRFTSAGIALKNSGFTVGTAPSTNRYWTYFFADSANAGCGRILKYVNKDGSSGIEIQDWKYNNVSTTVTLKVGFDSSGNAYSSSSTTFSAPCLKASTNNASNGIKIGTYTIYVG